MDNIYIIVTTILPVKSHRAHKKQVFIAHTCKKLYARNECGCAAECGGED